MNRTIARFALFGLGCAIPLAQLMAQGAPAAGGAADPWYASRSGPRTSTSRRRFTGAFRIRAAQELAIRTRSHRHDLFGHGTHEEMGNRWAHHARIHAAAGCARAGPHSGVETES
jgi:hypothetical protein